jgi:hypothetical protein
LSKPLESSGTGVQTQEQHHLGRHVLGGAEAIAESLETGEALGEMFARHLTLRLTRTSVEQSLDSCPEPEASIRHWLTARLSRTRVAPLGTRRDRELLRLLHDLPP